MNLLFIDRPLPLNTSLAIRIGLNESIVLQQLSYWISHDSGVTHDGCRWVYNTYSQWKEQVPFLSERTIQRTILKLEDMGIVRSEMLKKSRGDRTKYYTINQESEHLTIVPKWHDDSANMARSTSCQSGTLSTKTSTKTSSSVVNEVLEHLNARAGTAFRNAAGHAKFISARINDGATIDDLKLVIDKKCDEWLGTDMAKNLRPSTLFRPANFENYLGQLHVNNNRLIDVGYSAEDVIGLYNEMCGSVLPKCGALSGDREKAISKLSGLKLISGNQPFINHGLDAWQTYFNQALSTDWVIGKNDRGWKADIDYLLKDTNALKIMGI